MLLGKMSPSLAKTQARCSYEFQKLKTAISARLHPPTTTAPLRVLPGNAQAVGSRERQEDSCAFSNLEESTFSSHGGYLAVVADGMGGFHDGAEASKLATAAFVEKYSQKLPGTWISDALKESLFAANEAVYRYWKKQQNGSQIGTTLVAVVVHKNMAQWISVGDSRAYLIQRGKLKQLSTDHIYAEELDKQVHEKRIRSTEAKNHPQRESLTSYLGSDEIALISSGIHPAPLEPGDAIMLCTDGLYRALSDNEILSEFDRDSQHFAERLLQKVLKKELPSQDNISVAVLSCVEGSIGLGNKFEALRTNLPGSLKTQISRIRISPQIMFWGVVAALFLFIWLWSRYQVSTTGHP